MSDIRRQELHCHECNQYVQFNIDFELDGNHILNCPNCGHEHCRVVNNGVITGDRWDVRNSDTFQISLGTCSTSVCSFTTMSGGDTLMSGLWMDTTTSSTGTY